MSPTARTLDALRKQGHLAQVVERFNPYAKVRVDLFGCIDIIAVRDGKIVGIQATDATSHSKREAKALAEPRLKKWVDAGALFEVWSWRLAGPRGARKVWTLRTTSPVS